MASDQNAALLSAYGGRSKNLPQTLTLDHVSPATRLLEKRRQMFEVQEALDAQKEEFARREDAFRRREEALRKKDLELQESLIKFNKFLQENESKRNRAVKRAADEQRQRLQKEGEIEKLKAQEAEKREEEKLMRKQLELNEKYQRYLQEVVDKGSDDYHEIQDLLNRYNTLKTANKDLADTQTKAEQENEKKSVEYSHYKKERGNEILNANNDIANLQHRLAKREMDVKRAGLDHHGRQQADAGAGAGAPQRAEPPGALRQPHAGARQGGAAARAEHRGHGGGDEGGRQSGGRAARGDLHVRLRLREHRGRVRRGDEE
jgi:hypothetical protein